MTRAVIRGCALDALRPLMSGDGLDLVAEIGLPIAPIQAFSTSRSRTIDPKTMHMQLGHRLDGRVALNTGTACGRGGAAALTFADAGATVVGCDINGAGNAETAGLVRGAGGIMHDSGAVDMGDPEAAQTWGREGGGAMWPHRCGL